MSEPISLTAAELARRLNGVLRGDGARVVREIAVLDQAGPDAVSWLGSAAYLPKLETTRAGVVLVPADCAAPAEKTVIGVADPDLALCDVLEWLRPPVERVPPGVHPTAAIGTGAMVEGAAIGAHAHVGAGAMVGAGTQLHPGVYIGAHARIGRDCVLWPNVVVRERCVLGDRVIVHPNATIGADGFGYLFRKGKHHKIPQIGAVVIEDDVEIGANSCVDRARAGVTRVGRGTKIDNLVQIGHNAVVGEDCVIVAQCGVSGSATLGHHVVLAGQVGVVDHLRIGDGARIAAKSLVARDVPDGQVQRGIPAVENFQFLRQDAALRKLPKLLEQVRALARRIEQLDSTADDPDRS